LYGDFNQFVLSFIDTCDKVVFLAHHFAYLLGKQHLMTFGGGEEVGRGGKRAMTKQKCEVHVK
jgi:hypothetical protein